MAAGMDPGRSSEPVQSALVKGGTNAQTNAQTSTRLSNQRALSSVHRVRTRSASFKNLLLERISESKTLSTLSTSTRGESNVAVCQDSVAVSPENFKRTRSRELKLSPKAEDGSHMGGSGSTSLKETAPTAVIKRRPTAPELGQSKGALEVLVVEDCRVERLKLNRVLGLAGHVMTGVGSAELGLELLQQRWDENGSTAESFPGAILIDLSMPGGMSGMEMVKEIRSRYPFIDTPLIAHTGSKDFEDEDEDDDFCLSAYLIDAGFTDYAMKEPQSEGLLGLLRMQIQFSRKDKRVNTPM